MSVSIIVAMDENRLIGVNNTLPWHLPADLQHFKSVTMGKPIIMGRKTFDSIGRPLPGRENVVVTRDTAWQADGTTVVHSLGDALGRGSNADEAMIIGGASFYEQALPYVNKLYITRIHEQFESGDAWFPKFDLSEWLEVSRVDHAATEKNPHSHSFLVYERR